MEIHESFETRQGHIFTHLNIEGFEVSCVPCNVTVEVDEINRAERSIYFSVIDVEPSNKEDQLYFTECPEDFEVDTDNVKIQNLVFKHFDMEA